MKFLSFLLMLTCLYLIPKCSGYTNGNILKEIDELKKNIKDALSKCGHSKEEMENGPVYTRWGRRECPKNNVLLYNGFVATRTGVSDESSGSNVLCLPEKPEWRRYTDGLQNVRSRIYGANYETNGDTKPPISPDIDEGTMICAVCQAKSASNVVMVPAKTTCFPGWTSQYNGYLMADLTERKGATEYICVDENATYTGKPSMDHAVFGVVEAVCGQLPCNLYPSGRELACVVCTK